MFGRLPKEFLENIKSFPTPTNITDIHSWFGAINQISYAFATVPTMLPFRELLSSKVPFQWNDALDKAFQKSKEEIIQQCQNGVKSFNLSSPTCLATDWSRYGMGFWLTQKTCSCPSSTSPGCCKDGWHWQTVYCGSRFCTPAESRYHPIEGEAAAAMYSLEKCKAFVLGNPNLVLAIDHKPLLKILGNAEINEVINPKLLNFKIKSLVFSFKPMHIPGKKNVVPDTLLRRTDAPHPPMPRSPELHPSLSSPQVQAQYADCLSPPSLVTSPPMIGSAEAKEEVLIAAAKAHIQNFAETVVS